MPEMAASLVGAVPSVYGGIVNVAAVLMLLIEFLMLRAALLRAQLRLYALQSLIVSGLAAYVGATHHAPELYVLAVLSIALKVVIVPWVIRRELRTAETEIAGSGALGVASEVLIAIVVAAFGFFATGALGLSGRLLPTAALSSAVALMLVAFVIMTVRSDVVSQAVGFFTLENSVSLASLVVASGLPLILEVAFLFDLLVAVVVFGVLMRVHHGRMSTLSTEPLRRLRG
ncbi:MAG: hydrogenase [Actinomycetes bacterium]